MLWEQGLFCIGIQHCSSKPKRDPSFHQQGHTRRWSSNESGRSCDPDVLTCNLCLGVYFRCTLDEDIEELICIPLGTVQHDLLQFHTSQQLATGGLGCIKEILDILVGDYSSNSSHDDKLVHVAILAAQIFF